MLESAHTSSRVNRPLLTKRKRKQLTAGSKGRGEKQKHAPTAFISGCPFCEWHRTGQDPTLRPVEVRVQADDKIVRCRAGHTWRIE